MRSLAALILVALGTDAVAEPGDAERLHRTLSLVGELAYANDTIALPIFIPAEHPSEVDQLWENTAREYRGGYVELAATAGAASDLSSPGAIHGGAEASWQIPLCRIAGAHARGLATAERHGTWALGGTGCLPLPYNTVQVTYTRRHNIRGSLLASAIVASDRRAEHDLNIVVRMYRYVHEDHTFLIAPTMVDLNMSESAEDQPFGAQTMNLSLAMLEWRHAARGFRGEDTSVRLFAIRQQEQADAGSIGALRTSVATFTPLALEGLHITDALTFGVDVGIAMGWATDRTLLASQPSMAVQAPVAQRNTGHVDVWLGMDLAPLTAQLRYARTLAPTFDGQFVLENRVTASATATRDKLLARGEAFAGHATISRPGPNDGARIHGAGGDLAYALLPRVHAIGRVEGARVLSPGVATDPVSARWELRATIGLAAHYDKRL